MLQSSPKVEHSSLITDYFLAIPYERIDGEKTTMLLLLDWSSECIEIEQAWGFQMFLADQQAGIPPGMLVIDQSDKGVGVGAEMIGRAGETGANPC